MRVLPRPRGNVRGRSERERKKTTYAAVVATLTHAQTQKSLVLLSQDPTSFYIYNIHVLCIYTLYIYIMLLYTHVTFRGLSDPSADEAHPYTETYVTRTRIYRVIIYHH